MTKQQYTEEAGTTQIINQLSKQLAINFLSSEKLNSDYLTHSIYHDHPNIQSSVISSDPATYQRFNHRTLLSTFVCAGWPSACADIKYLYIGPFAKKSV